MAISKMKNTNLRRKLLAWKMNFKSKKMMKLRKINKTLTKTKKRKTNSTDFL